MKDQNSLNPEEGVNKLAHAHYNLGDGLINLIQDYPSDEQLALEVAPFVDQVVNDAIDSNINTSLDYVADPLDDEVMEDSSEDQNIFLLGEIEMVPPGLAHLQLQLGRVSTSWITPAPSTRLRSPTNTVRHGATSTSPLGPRFIDWWWNAPLSVDADLLPQVVPGYKTPFRQCPPGVGTTLADGELTYLCKLARPLSTHFALGRTTKLHGLAAAILKLWKKSLIAKIAVKVGIQNTSNEKMAWNLKAMQHLIGGTIILRNKAFIILYRGKDFLPGGVKRFVIDQEARIDAQHVKEEEARLTVIDSLQIYAGLPSEESSVGTFREYQDFQVNYVHETTENNQAMVELEAEKHRLEKELRLFIHIKKIERSNQTLAKLHSSWNPSEPSSDKELLTKEEMMIFRKIGLKMDEHVLLGRRGIFDGVIEEIHQHWKHKEIVKVITKQTRAYQITYTSMLLEVETGGMLIATQKLTNSHAIIIYRGQNYRRPTKSEASNLLTKREALQRSVEVQRRGLMKYYVWETQKSIEELNWTLANVTMKIRKLT
ncbi:chloroplastic group IIA intron splicing facilitator CRS1, chloroplastic-like [Lolium rigidum]|uniref:chloroplastic group IIA intron splicing facilitator CRS1, chloroplastic-like n=1 Tax=Lolium rigidum TaxID=89674 RepID=UPI001F5C20A2|nr:chloroplastic group IIA intron splicing facilitator CRS1, chloroplastic-like [Lolium rigidum]